jgi:Ca2+:H+ antiporter
MVHARTAAPGGDLRGLRHALLGSKGNLLLLFLPVAVVLELVHASQTWVFVASALAIVPLAGLIGTATEDLSLHVGPGLGGLLNATFGNGAELLIAGLALHRGLVDVVKASISGSIIGNLLLVLGAAVLAGGWGRDVQRFSATSAGAQTSMMFLAVVALVMPAVYDLTVLGSLTATSRPLELLSLCTAVVLLVAYAAGLWFSLRTHGDVFRGEESGTPAERPPMLSARAAVILLAIATAATAASAEVLVGSVEEFSHGVGLTDLFVGMVVVAIVGNAAEHWSAVVIARAGNMQLAMNIPKSSSVQIALMVAPLLILFSWVLGTPMSLVFHPFELFGIALAVGAAGLVSLDGQTHWFEGVLLLAVYALLAIAVFFVPG